MQLSTKFFKRIFFAFFDRVDPTSKAANPVCIKKTKNALINIHKVFVSDVSEGSK